MPTLVRRLIPVTSAESLAVFADPAVEVEQAYSTAPISVVLVPPPFGSAFGMRHVTAALATRGIPTVVIDLLGMGSSPRPAGADYSLARQAQRIRAVLDTLRIERAIVVAQGTSATVALHLAADDPARVVGVLSLAGGLVTQQGTRTMRVVLAMSFLLDNPLGRALARRKFESGLREQSADVGWITRDVLQQYVAPFAGDLRGTLRALKAMQGAIEPVSIADRLPLIQAPVHLLVGDKPMGSAPTDAQISLLRRSLSSFTVDTVAHSGTMVHEEHPDVVVAAILAMIRPF